MSSILVSGSFDNLRSQQLRFLEEASHLGAVDLILWSDEKVESVTGKPPKFPLAERKYVMESVRFVNRVMVDTSTANRLLPELVIQPQSTWVVTEEDDTPEKRTFCSENHLFYRVVPKQSLCQFSPLREGTADTTAKKRKVMVTGCFDWLHSGHVRFFEEVSELGDLFVVVGHDANIRLLKGDGHPLFPQAERQFMVQAIRFVHRALISTGTGWMDAAPEVDRIKPDMYAVNEDGDKPEKRAFCLEHGLEYVVLKRTPKPGLPRRQSTDLRGF